MTPTPNAYTDTWSIPKHEITPSDPTEPAHWCIQVFSIDCTCWICMLAVNLNNSFYTPNWEYLPLGWICRSINLADDDFTSILICMYHIFRDLSQDESFIDEIRSSIRFLVAVLFRRFSKVRHSGWKHKNNVRTCASVIILH